MALSAKFTELNLWIYSWAARLMIVFTPNRIENKFNTRGYFLEFILFHSSLKTLARSIVTVSPVSWHLALNISACISVSNTKNAGFLENIAAKLPISPPFAIIYIKFPNTNNLLLLQELNLFSELRVCCWFQLQSCFRSLVSHYDEY